MFYGTNRGFYVRGNLNISYLEQHLHYPISLNLSLSLLIHKCVGRKKGTTHTGPAHALWAVKEKKVFAIFLLKLISWNEEAKGSWYL